MNNRLFILILSIFSLLFARESYARFYASMVMHNKELGKTIICFPDNHRFIADFQADAELDTKDHCKLKINQAEYNLACQQQQELLELINNLQKINYSVCVLVEDKPSFCSTL